MVTANAGQDYICNAVVAGSSPARRFASSEETGGSSVG